MSRFEEREGERETKNNLTDISIIDKYKFITDETDEEANKKEKGLIIRLTYKDN